MKYLITLFVALFACLAFAGGYGNQEGGSGGKGGDGGSGVGVGVGVGIAGAGAYSSGGSGSATSGGGSQTLQGNDVRSYALSGGSVGSPANDTCAAHFSVLFGFVTAPTTMKSCVAERQAVLLANLGRKDAAISRLCQLEEIQATGICPVKIAPKGEDVKQAN